MKSVCTFFAFVLITSAAQLASAATADKPQVQGQLLDKNEYLCDNCLFGSSSYYYCIEADNKILIGYQKVPAINWKDPASNDLTKVHKSWEPWTSEGQTIPLRYDDKYIWLTRSDGKQVRLKQDYTTDIFINSQQCRAAVKKK
jgi:hypothetical protein